MSHSGDYTRVVSKGTPAAPPASPVSSGGGAGVSRVGTHKSAERLFAGSDATRRYVRACSNQASATELSRMIVSSRSDPVDRMAAGTPVISSMRAM
jgi:hypothetical protein